MNYITHLLKEHSRTNTDAIAKAVGNDANEFKKIVHIIYNEKAPLPQRAAWLLAIINKQQPSLLYPYISKFIATVNDCKIDAIKRNIMTVLATQTIPKKLQGKLVDICFNFILSPTETVVVKVHALQCIANLAKEHPELIPELKSAIENQLPKTTAAFHARAKMVMKQLKKNSNHEIKLPIQNL